jgi:hypothetical protein
MRSDACEDLPTRRIPIERPCQATPLAVLSETIDRRL